MFLEAVQNILTQVFFIIVLNSLPTSIFLFTFNFVMKTIFLKHSILHILSTFPCTQEPNQQISYLYNTKSIHASFSEYDALYLLTLLLQKKSLQKYQKLIIIVLKNYKCLTCDSLLGFRVYKILDIVFVKLCKCACAYILQSAGKATMSFISFPNGSVSLHRKGKKHCCE